MASRLSAELRTTFLAAYLLVGFEWLFFVTKSSIFNDLPSVVSVRIGLNTALLLFCVAATVHLALRVLSSLMQDKINSRCPNFAALVPAFVFTVLLVLLFDNFTYTLFHWGVVRTKGATRWVLLAAVLICWAAIARKVLQRWAASASAQPRRRTACAAVGGVSAAVASATVLWAPPLENIVFPATIKRFPNIVFFASDGIDANHTSFYGYARRTTPNLDALRERGLTALAAVSNSNKTSSSTNSMLTGFLPTTTHMLFPPQIFTGKFARFSLPAILRRFGYVAEQISLNYYGDSPTFNLRGAFDHSNGSAVTNDRFDRLPLPLRTAFEYEFIFSSQLYERVKERILHLTSRRDMVDVFSLVRQTTLGSNLIQTDQARVDEAKQFIAQAKRPFFLHLHLMNTHCCDYPPADRRFTGSPPKDPAVIKQDLYDSEVARSDEYFKQIMDALRAKGVLERTLVIYSSDHGSSWSIDQRVPLVLFFPRQEYTGTISETVQLADVVPTVLEYLGADPQPELEGRSLIRAEKLDRMRPIFSVGRMYQNFTETRVMGLESGAPNRGLMKAAVTVCQRQYLLNLADGTMEARDLAGHPAPCAAPELPTIQKAEALLREHLEARGYTVAPLKSADSRR